MSMAVEDSVCEAWILECRGGYSVAFSEIEHAAMVEVLQSGDVTLDMFVTKGGLVTKEDAREMWAIVLDEWDKLIVQATGARTKPIRMAKLLTWCIAITSVTSGGGSLDALAAAAEASAGKAEKASAPAEVIKAQPACSVEEEVMSVQMAKDMADQGVSDVTQLMQIYISCQLGRIANKDEYLGLSYQTHWTAAKGLKQIEKNPSGLGQKTLAQHLEAARMDGNLAPVEKFIQRTGDRFLLSGQPVFLIAGSRLLSRWSRAKSFQPTDGRVAATYLVMYWDDLPGRGIPEVVDFDLMRDAERAVLAQGLSPSGAGLEALVTQKTRSSTGSDTGSSVSWGGASSVSNASTKKLEEMMVTLQESLGSQISSLASEVSGIKKGHGDLASRIGQIKPSGGGLSEPGGRKCYYCGEPGHTQQNCPALAKLKKKAAAADAKGDDD